MKKEKISFGIRVKKNLADKIDSMIDNLHYLNTTRSEVIETLIEAFFASPFNHEKRAEEFLINKRKREKQS